MALQKDTEGYVYGVCDAKPAAVQLTQNDRGLPRVRVEMQVVGGEHDGKRFPYEPSLKPEQIKWGKAGLKALGWQGKTLRTLSDDILKNPVTVQIEIRVASYQPNEGPLRRWSSVDRIAGAMPVTDMGAEALAKADAWFAEADDVGGTSNGASGDRPTLPNDGLPF